MLIKKQKKKNKTVFWSDLFLFYLPTPTRDEEGSADEVGAKVDLDCRLAGPLWGLCRQEASCLRGTGCVGDCLARQQLPNRRCSATAALALCRPHLNYDDQLQHHVAAGAEAVRYGTLAPAAAAATSSSNHQHRPPARHGVLRRRRCPTARCVPSNTRACV
jgi:hypothetical protein